MIILSAGCASLASLMRHEVREAEPDTKRAPVEADRRPRLVSANGADQRAIWVSPALHRR